MKGSPAFVLAVVAGLVCGCVRMPQKSYPRKQAYAWDVAREGEPTPAPAEAVLRVVVPFGLPAVQTGRGFVYRMEGLGYTTDYYHEFVVHPGALLGDTTREWIARAGLFQQVADTASALDPTHLLEGTVTALYGDYRPDKPPTSVLEIRFTLLRLGRDNPEVLLNKSFREEVPLEDTQPATLMAAWNQSLNRILGSLEEELGKTMDKGPKGGLEN